MLANRMLAAASSGASAATIEWIEAKVSTSTLSTFTFAGTNFGAAATDRDIFLAVGLNNITGTITGVTAGGETGSVVIQVADASNYRAAVCRVRVPTGTTGTVEITLSSSASLCVAEIYGAYGADTTAHATMTDVTSDPLNGTMNVPANGFAVAAAFNNSGSSFTWTWTGLTEDDEQLPGSFVGVSSASENFSAAETGRTIEADPSSASGGGRALAACSFGPP